MAADPRRLTAQLLAGRRASSVDAVVERLLAVQAQDPRGARLAVRARSRGLAASDVDTALDDGRAVVTWLNRGTLHLVRAEDYWWLHALTTPPLVTGNARRLRQEGVSADDAERGVAAVEKALAKDGPLTRDELRQRVARAKVRTEGQALVHVLMLATLRGIAVRGPMRGGDHAYVLVRDWLGTPPKVDRDKALRDLGARYLAGHGPADARDLAKWSGLPLRDARAALDGARTPGRKGGEAAPRLLGPYDPLLLGWASRADVVGSHTNLVTVNGLFRPFALAGGEAVATWRAAKSGPVIEPFRPLDDDVAAALEDDARDVERFLSG